MKLDLWYVWSWAKEAVGQEEQLEDAQENGQDTLEVMAREERESDKMSEVMKCLQQMEISEGHGWKPHQVSVVVIGNGE